jgi:Tol biopolymer transport system component
MIRPILLALCCGCAGVLAAPSDPPGAAAQAARAGQFEQAVTLLETRGDARGALTLFQAVAGGSDRTLAARALVYVGLCHERLGNEAATAAYERVVRDFADQRAAVAQARARLTALTATRPSRTGLTLRRLWAEAPVANAEIGTASLDGRLFALLGSSGDLTLQDTGSLRLRPSLRLGQAGPDRSACQPAGPVLAPDAAAVAYLCWSDGGAELRTASLSDPRTERVLHRVTGGDELEAVEWRRPEAVLARITGADHHTRIALVATGARPGVRIVADLAYQPGGVSISPDHRWLAVDAPDSYTPARRDIVLIPVDGAGGARTLAGGEGDDLLPVWTPDGSALTWISDRTGTSGLWTQRITNGAPAGAPTQLAPDLGRVAFPMALTASGTYIYFRQVGHVDVHTVALDEAGDPAGPPVVDGTRYVGATMSPTFSASGRMLAYRVELGVSRAHAIGIRDLDAGRERIITPAMGWIGLPRWSPDGTRLLVRGRDARGRYGLFFVDAATGDTAALRIVPPAEEDQLGTAQWERDGRGIILAARRQLARTDLATGREEVLTTVPEGASLAVLPDAGFAVSAVDGSVAFLQQAGGISSLHVRGPDGASREIFRGSRDERLASVAWMPGNRGLLFARIGRNPSAANPSQWPAIWRVDPSGGAPRPLGVSMRGLREIVVSADGRTLAFTGGWPTREPWVVEHLPISPAIRPARR